VREGEVFAGKYRIDAIIGSGAMGIVVSARHLLLQKKVAIKFLRLERLDRGDAISRFVEEARAADRIKSKHVVHISDVDVLDGGPPYIVMEYLEGSDLAGWLRERGPLGVEAAVDFLLEASEALAEAHKHGIVHRDLKPANLFVHRSGGAEIIKILDFGISKRAHLVPQTLDLADAEAIADVTQSKMVLGSPEPSCRRDPHRGSNRSPAFRRASALW
jgi:serine/threonine-protein kinase